MNSNELRGKSVEELDSLLADLYKEQFNLRMQKGTGQLGSPHLFKKVKKEIARIKTIKTEMAGAE